MTAEEACRVPSTGEGSEPTRVQAGPLTALFVDGDLRRILWHGREVVRRIHGAVRDRDWGTVPGVTRDLRIEGSGTSFCIGYFREHRQGGIHLEWRAEIRGDDDGTIRFEFDGVAKSDFLANRIGLCLLHPIRECAGAACRTRHTDGTTEERTFPEHVAAEQPIPGFTDLSGVAHEVEPGVWLEAAFEGNVFETEDQRNWIDASFKTYSTPLRLPFPVAVRSGTRIRQAVVIRLLGAHGTGPATPPSTWLREPAAISWDGTGPLPVPGIGLGVSSRAERTWMHQARWLAGLGLSHLRVDLRLGRTDWVDHLASAVREASDLGTALELAVHLPRDGADRLDEVARELHRLGAGCRRALILREGWKSTRPGDLEAARRVLSFHAEAIGAGTAADLYQIHLEPPPLDGDFLCWSMNPQVHATDDMSLLETPEAVAHQLATLRHRHPGLPRVVSPITLRPRFNPVATSAADASGDRPSAAAIDPRQPTLLAAAWTVAMLKALCEGGAAALTFFETTGPLGVMESGSLRVFPVYHVLADVGEFARGRILPTRSGDPAAVHPVLLRHDGILRLVVANGTPDSLCVSLPRRLEGARIRTLDESTVESAMDLPERFRSGWDRFAGDRLEMRPYSIATLDFTED
jgi:D-apionolactonase